MFSFYPPDNDQGPTVFAPSIMIVTQFILWFLFIRVTHLIINLKVRNPNFLTLYQTGLPMKRPGHELTNTTTKSKQQKF